MAKLANGGVPKSNGEGGEPDDRLQLVSVKQAAARLNCSPTNVYALIEKGELPVVRVGQSKGYRIDLRDLDDFVCTRKFSYRDDSPKIPRQRLKHIRR